MVIISEFRFLAGLGETLQPHLSLEVSPLTSCPFAAITLSSVFSIVSAEGECAEPSGPLSGRPLPMAESGGSWYLGNVRVDVNPPQNGEMNVHVAGNGHPHAFSLVVTGGDSIKLSTDGDDCFKSIKGTSVSRIIMT